MLVLAALLLVLIVAGLLLSNRKDASSARELFLSQNSHYAWMVTDSELRVKPTLDLCYPLPTFRTLKDTIQTVTHYSYDLKQAFDDKHSAVAKGDQINVADYVRQTLTQLLQSLNDKEQPVTITDLQFKVITSEIIAVKLQLQQTQRQLYLSFKRLPDQPDPRLVRRAVNNVGYFSNQVTAGQRNFDLIQCYKRPLIRWAIAPDIPKAWWLGIKRAIAFWNTRLNLHGVQLVLQEEVWKGHIADPNINLFSTVRTQTYTGVATTTVDSRTGEHQWSRVLIAPNALRERVELFGDAAPQLLQLVDFVLIHELGHTLGLRHNFVAPLSSYMSYPPTWFPSEQGELHFMPVTLNGDYDRFAIEYGYRSVKDESLYQASALLQSLIDQQQQLFHSDENIDNDRVLANVHRRALSDGLIDVQRWLQAWRRYRTTLFTDVSQHTADVKRVFFFLDALTTASLNAVKHVNGFTTDYRRQRLRASDKSQQVLSDLAEYLLGDSWRLTEIADQLTNVTLDEFGQVQVRSRPYNGFYTVDPAPLELLHLDAVLLVLDALFTPKRVAVMTDPAAVLSYLLMRSSAAVAVTKNVVADYLYTNLLAGAVTTVQFHQEHYTATAQLQLTDALQQVLSKVTALTRRKVDLLVNRSATRSFKRSRRKGDDCGCRLPL